MTIRPDPEQDDPRIGDDRLASVIDVARTDEVASICGQIDAAPTYAVVVNAPNGNRSLASELGIRLLARHAEESGKAVAIATRSSSLAARARQAGIPVARKPQHVRWDAGGRRVFRLGPWSVAPPGFGGYIQALIVLLILAVIAGLGLTMGPSATVVLTPPSRERSVVVPVLAIRDLDSADVDGLRVPGRVVTETRLLTLTAKATGTTRLGTRTARAGLTLVNTGLRELTVPAGALVVGPGEVRFLVEAEVVVGPGQSQAVTATAAAPGEAGNVAAGTLTKLADPAFAAVQVANAAAATGGTSEDVPAVAAADLTAIGDLARGLQSSSALRSSVFRDERKDVVLRATLELETAPDTPYPAAGEPSDLVFIDVAVTAHALAVPREALEALADGLLRTPDDGPLVSGSVRAHETGAIVASEDEGTRTELEISGRFVSGVSEDDIINAVEGKSEGDAEANLRERYGVENADVQLSPGWAPWIPRFGFRISVEFRVESADDRVQDADAKPTPTATPSPGP